MFHILHVSKFMEFESDGIDTVFNALTDAQNNITGVTVSNVATSNFFNTISKIKLVAKSDVCVFHRMYDINSLILMFYCALFNKKYVLFPHSAFTSKSQEKSKYKKILLRFLAHDYLIKKASAIHYLTEDEKESSFPSVEKYFIIPNGITVPEIDEYQNDGFLYLSYLGRYDINHKGIDLLVEAIGLNKELFENSNVKLVMHGYFSNSSDRQKLGDLISENHVENIIVVNDAIFGEDKIRFIQQSLAYVLTSRYEGMPLSVLEALSLNKFCLLTKGTNMEELIISNSWGLCSETNVESISNMLFNFISNYNELRHINSKDIIKEMYSWNNIANELSEKYKKI